MCMWLALLGRLKTVDHLQFLEISKRCIICNCFDESNKHIFFECSGTKTVWNRVKEWLKIRRHMSTIPMAIKWLVREQQGSGVLGKARWVGLAASVYYIWNAHNRLHFDDEPFCAQRVLKNIQNEVYRVLYSMFPVEVVVSHLGVWHMGRCCHPLEMAMWVSGFRCEDGHSFFS